MNSIILFTVSTLLFLAVSAILLYILSFVKGFLYEEEEEPTHATHNAYYNHKLKVISYLGFVEEVKHVNDIFKAIEKTALKHNLPVPYGFITELGGYHYIEINQLTNNTYDIAIHKAKYRDTLLNTLRDPEYKPYMHKITDEQDLFEILCDAYKTLVTELYWEHEQSKPNQQEEL